MNLEPLPADAAALLDELAAPPRLVAHLRLVHDVACRLAGWMDGRVVFDREAMLFGAATHDIGKVLHAEELSGPGNLHERAGRELLLSRGVEERLAKFAGSHGSWSAGVSIEELLVSLADKVWKAKRVQDLEQLVVERLPGEPWEAFMALDDELDRIARDADRRLAFQNSHPLSHSGGPRRL